MDLPKSVEVEGLGTFRYSNSMKYYQSILIEDGESFYINVETNKENGVNNISNIIKNVMVNIRMINKKAIHHIKTYNSEENCSNLHKKYLVFYENGSFQIGYDAGQSQTGYLTIYVTFHKDFSTEKGLIFEVY